MTQLIDHQSHNAAQQARDTPDAVNVRQLSHRYPGAAERPALDDVSFDIQPGEIFGILGPNGGGKTTLFRILATLLQPQTPDAAHIFGHDVQHAPADVRRALGVVFQHPSLDHKLTARENLRHQGRLYGIATSQLNQCIEHWLTQFDLADRADEYTERFSGGMRRRVEIAKAMLHQPRLLLMDEPATGLDPGARRDLWRQIEQLRDQQHVTVALTTHLMDEAERCDRLAILSRGRLVAVDTPTNLKARVGGDVITVEPAPDDAQGAEQLAQQITAQCGPWDSPDAEPKVVDGQVRFEKHDGTSWVATLSHHWSDRIRRITVGQPTLEDVFLDLTGAAFRDEEL